MKWPGLGKFCFHSVKMFYLNLSCMFPSKIESFNMEITQNEKKKNGPEKKDHILTKPFLYFALF